jgi:hypothetical protein
MRGYDDTASDRLLREAGALRRAGDPEPCYTEAELARKTRQEVRAISREIRIGQDVQFAEDTLLVGPESPRVTIDELAHAACLTARQRLYIRLMRRYRQQAHVAAYVGVVRSTVSETLSRAYLRIQAAYPALQERLPANWARQLFEQELRRKRQLIYHRPPAQNVSAFLHAGREARRISRERSVVKGRNKRNRN